MDGTLIDTSDLIFRSFEYALDQVLHTKLPREDLLWTFGQPLAVAMKELGGTQAEQLHQAFTTYSIAHEHEIGLFPDVRETLEQLKAKGIKLAIVTSRVYHSTIRDLDIVQLRDYFDIIITPELTAEHKPHPAPALKALELLHLAPEETIMVGDSPSDLNCGRQANCYTAAVAYSMFPQEQLAEHQPNYVVHSLAELLPLL